MRKDEGDWYGKRAPELTGRSDLLGWGMAGTPPGDGPLRPAHAASAWASRLYGLLAFFAFVAAAAEAAVPPRDWTFVTVCALFGATFLTVWIVGRKS